MAQITIFHCLWRTSIYWYITLILIVPLVFYVGALNVIVTPLFNHSRGSILLPAFFHLLLINPLWPDAQLYDTRLFVVVAAVVVWFNRISISSLKPIQIFSIFGGPWYH